MIVFFFSRLKSPLPTHKSSSPSACLSSGGTRDIQEAKKLHIYSPFPTRFEEGKRVLTSETLLIGMGKRLTPPSRLISELQCLSRRICCTRSPLRRRGNTRWDFTHPCSYFCLGSVPDPWHFGTDPYYCLCLTDPAPDPALFVSDLQDANKKLLLLFFAYNFLKVHLHHSSQINKSCRLKSFKTVEIEGFLLFLLDGRMIRIRTSTSDRRIQEAQKLTEPEHCMGIRICPYDPRCSSRIRFFPPSRTWGVKKSTGSRICHSLTILASAVYVCLSDDICCFCCN